MWLIIFAYNAEMKFGYFAIQTWCYLGGILR